jgi:hypothetical protein
LKINKHKILTILYVVWVIRPSLLYYSNSVSRSIELLTILIYVIILIFNYTNQKKSITLWLVIILLSYTLSISLSSFNNTIVTSDFNELLRPVIWFTVIGLFKGLGEKSILKLNIKLCLFAGIIVFLQFFFRDYFSWVYKLYSNYNLYFQQRPAGFFYTHTEISLMSLLGIYSVVKLKKTLAKKDLVLIFFFLLSGSLGQSKSGILMIVSFLFFYFLSNKNSTSLTFKGFFIIASVSTLIFIASEFNYIYNGFIDLFYMRSGNLSIGNRLEDIDITKQKFTETPASIIFGNGPLRAYPSISYIEITLINVLFRFGIIGLLLYYFPLFFHFRKKEAVIKALILSIMIGDITSNMSETLKAFPLILATLFTSKKDHP